MARPEAAAIGEAGISCRVQAAAPEGWEAITRETKGAGPAQRPSLWAALAAVLPGLDQRVIVVERNGVAIGGAPLMVERRGPFLWLHALPLLFSGAPLARAGDRELVDRAVAHRLAALQHELDAAGGEWAVYRPGEPPPPADALESPSGETRLGETSIMDLSDGLEAAWKRVDRTLRYELRRARVRGLEMREEPDALAETYALHVEQSRQWPGHRVLPIDLTRRLLEPRVDKAFHPHGPVARLFTIRHGRRLLAGTIFLDSEHETFAWWSGARSEGRGDRAHAYLYWSAAQWACLAGRARMNLGGSTGVPALKRFKLSLGAEHHPYPVRWLDARHASARVRLVSAAQSWWRRGRVRGERA